MVAAHAALAGGSLRSAYLPETRAYSPHVTLARVKEPGRAARAVRQALARRYRPTAGRLLEALTLFRSRLSPQGASTSRCCEYH